ncbi:alkane 1-monooxygenase [Ferrimonas marina]|uniref:Fatty acid desaturase n=1 Tax=Ferrimonas marina TaxID=299255 RepID=A0A1M5YDM5_9GAMM|nr:alkane 1-monooxygenase [Ferrimonas marina]SHI10135.1 Fatty acid desaturase [Ferrimonas marina]
MGQLKFLLMYLLVLPHFAGLLIGGWGLFLGPLAMVLLLCLGEALAGEDHEVPEPGAAWRWNAMLYLALPLVAMIALLALWLMAPGDLLGIGATVQGLTGWDAVSGKADNTLLGLVAAMLGSGLLIAALGTIVGHELIHRPWGSLGHSIGRWLLAFSWDSNFAIEHVYGHHRFLGSPQDPATAPRGRSVYSHIWRSTLGGYQSAWRIEAKRLATRRQAVLSWHNRFLRGALLSLLLSTAALWLAGWGGFITFTLVALIAKAYLEIVNYMEHYGLVRDPRTQVQPHHSWNSNNAFSSWATFNLTRHSHHHATGALPFWRLQPMPDTPMMPAGYMTTLLLTLVPPLWYRIMAPRLDHWDQHFASEHERQLLTQGINS